MRLVFMGTPEFAVPTLRGLVARDHHVVAAYTRPPARGGRGLSAKPSPVHAAANGLGIPVLHPRSLRGDDVVREFQAHRADLAIVVAYGLILPQTVLDAPKLGCLNLHGSLLPRWRGAAPIQRAIMAGDEASGVAVMRMEAGLDTGPVALEQRVAVAPEMTAGDLHDLLAPIGADLMGRALDALADTSLSFTPQSAEGVTYAAKIDKSECRITWTRSAGDVLNQIRGLSPAPGAFFEANLGSGSERIKVLRARRGAGAGKPGTVLDEELTVACGEGAVQLTQVQRAGKAALSAGDFLRGARVPTGTGLASDDR